MLPPPRWLCQTKKDDRPGLEACLKSMREDDTGEMTSNRREDQEISMLSLHLLQNCMVYVNTLMLQEVLAQPHWQGRLTETDLRALTPLTWEHVNPYGRFELDMSTRLPLK